MTDPFNSHEPTDPAASPGLDAPALPAGPAPTDYPSGGYPPYSGPYASGAQPGYDPQWAYAPPPGYGMPPGYGVPPGYGGKSRVAAGVLALALTRDGGEAAGWPRAWRERLRALRRSPVPLVAERARRVSTVEG